MGRRAGASRPRRPRSAPSRARGAPGGVHGGLRNETSVNETGLRSSAVSCLATVALTAATKTAVGRPDTHGSITNGFGGSFPSGHVTTVIVCLGLAVLVAHPRAGRWVWLVPALGGGLMAAVAAAPGAHWFTDIVGGGLLATGSISCRDRLRSESLVARSSEMIMDPLCLRSAEPSPLTPVSNSPTG